jgi:AI-2 transport protein TqsA
MSTTKPDAEHSSSSLAATARVLVILAASWFLLRELGVILKPFLLAVILGYIIIPLHTQVKKRVPKGLSVVASAVLTILIVILFTWLIQTSVRTVATELPLVIEQRRADYTQMWMKFEDRYPTTAQSIQDFAQAEMVSGDGTAVRDFTTRMVGAAANTLSVALVVGLYLLFLLFEVGHFSERVHNAFPAARAKNILQTVETINQGISDYLTAKVKASLILAVPIFLILLVFNVKLALVWGLIAFFCNFIPYLGSVISYSLPTVFVFAQFGISWEPITIAILMLAVHLATASFVEPAM